MEEEGGPAPRWAHHHTRMCRTVVHHEQQICPMNEQPLRAVFKRIDLDQGGLTTTQATPHRTGPKLGFGPHA